MATACKISLLPSDLSPKSLHPHQDPPRIQTQSSLAQREHGEDCSNAIDEANLRNLCTQAVIGAKEGATIAICKV
jgi:hypothetical protein